MTHQTITAAPVRKDTVYDWNRPKAYVIAGRHYNPPTQEEVREYFEKKRSPHPWRVWDAGMRYIAFDRPVDMEFYAPYNNKSTSEIIATPLCGTAGCHAGTAVSIIPDVENILPGVIDKSKIFGEGRAILAAYLTGYAENDVLDQWAHCHPCLWGNYNGECIFYETTVAFGNYCEDEYLITSKRIGIWWLLVARRIVEREKRIELRMRKNV